MSARTKLTGAAILALAAAFLVYQLCVNDGAEVRSPAPEAAASLPAQEEAPPEEATEVPIESVSIEDDIADDEESEKVELKPERAVISGVVTDKATGEPVKAYSLAILVSGKPVVEFVVDETVRDDEGRFLFPVDEGTYDILVRTPDYLMFMRRGIEAVRGEKGEELVIELDRGKSILGSVSDDATGLPVAGAVIMPWSRQFNQAGLYLARLQKGQGEVINHTISGEDGRFILSGLRAVSGSLVAVHPDYVVASQAVEADKEVAFRLKKNGHCIFGRVTDGSGLPVAGIAVYANNDDSWLGRPVFTGEDGRYRTAPIPPGMAYVVADQSRTPGGGDLDFGHELKRVLIEDRDMEVDFGPSPGQVTWQGSVFDEDGGTIGGAQVFLYPSEMAHITSIWMNVQYNGECDGEGRFEILRIEPGSYNVTVFSERHRYRDWRGITFSEPGVIRQDIRLSLPAFSGTVVDAATGAPITGTRGQLIALSKADNSVAGTSSINDQGRFAIGSLDPGSYDLSVNMNGYTSYRVVATIQMKAGERINGFTIPLARGGTVRLRVTGCELEATDQPFVHFRHEAGRTMSWPLARNPGGGESVMSCICTLEAGAWTAAVAAVGIGYADRAFTISPGRTTELSIGREDFSLHAEPVTVNGKIVNPDGSPAADCALRFSAHGFVAVAAGERGKECRTDREGRFSLDGFRPGFWTVRAVIADGAEIRLPDLVVPSRPRNPFLYDRTLAGGTVAGELSVRDGVRPPDGPETPVRLALFDLTSSQEACILNAPGKLGPFAMKNIAPGRYVLRAAAHGLGDWTSQAFEVAEGQRVDMGRIVLEPCGRLILAVKDRDGNVVEDFSLFLDEAKLSRTLRLSLSQGRFSYNNLPLGDVTIRIHAEGFRDKTVDVTLSAGEPAETEVVLDRD